MKIKEKFRELSKTYAFQFFGIGGWVLAIAFVAAVLIFTPGRHTGIPYIGYVLSIGIDLIAAFILLIAAIWLAVVLHFMKKAKSENDRSTSWYIFIWIGFFLGVLQAAPAIFLIGYFLMGANI